MIRRSATFHTKNYCTNPILFLVSTIGIFLITASAFADSVKLSWDPNSPKPTGYRVYQRTQGQAYNFNRPVWTGSYSTATVKNLNENTQYYFVVRAYSGNLESANSNEVAFKSAPSASPPPSSGSASSGSSETSTSGATSGSTTVSGGAVVIEAENYNTKVSRGGRSWVVAAQSGTTVMKTTPDAGANVASGYVSKSPFMRFNLSFTRTGIHYIWIRGKGVSNGNTVHVGLDGKAVTTAEKIGIPVNQGFTWSASSGSGRARVNVSRTGAHTLEVYMREDGCIVDKILISTSSSYTPSGDVAASGGTSSSSVPSSSTSSSSTSSGSTSSGSTSGGGSTASSGTVVRQDGGANGLVTLQAEKHNGNVDASRHSWVTANYGGTAAMEVVPDSGARIASGYVSNSPYLQFDVDFVKTGPHYVWLRGHCLGNDNTAHVGIDRRAISTSQAIAIPVNNDWQWSGTMNTGQRAYFNVSSPGRHTVEVYMREDGLMLDQICITTSPGYRP